MCLLEIGMVKHQESLQASSCLLQSTSLRMRRCGENYLQLKDAVNIGFFKHYEKIMCLRIKYYQILDKIIAFNKMS